MQTDDGQLPSMEKERLVDARNRHLRASEEVCIIEDEMLCVLQSLAGEFDTLMNVIESYSGGHVGVILALQEKALKTKIHYFRCQSVFARYIGTPDIPGQLSSSSSHVSFDTQLTTLEDEIDAVELDDDDEESDEEM